MFRIILFILLFFGLNAFAQQSVMKPPPVTVDELAESVYPKDSGAVAAYKHRYGKTWFELEGGGSRWIMVTEVYTRIKIYKKAGLEYANAQIMYYSDTRRAKGFFSEAVTYNLVNGAIEQTPLKKDGQFEEEFEEDFIIKKMVMPNVKEGSVIDYKYTIRTPYFAKINDWYFQFDIPADKVWYELFIPIYFTYNKYTTGFVPINTGIVNFVHNSKTDVEERHYHYMAKDVKAIKNEQYVNNIENYTAVLKHELASISYPNAPTKRLSVDWNTLARYIYENDRFGKELEFHPYFEKDIDPIVKADHTPRQKADSIFAFVRKRMEWNKYMGFFCRKGVKKAYDEKTGNVAEINLMLTSMLRYAGLQADPVLVSTRPHGIALFPTPFAFDYVISSVTIDGNIILLDATSKYSLPGVLPERVLNWYGRMVKKDSISVEVDLMPKKNSHETINVMAQIDAGGKVSGKVRNLYMEYIGNILRELFAIIPKEGYVEKLEAANKGTVISNYRLLNDKDPDKVLTENYDFTNTMLTDVLAGKIYFSPMLFFAEKENPFISETRDYPVDFMYPLQKRHIVTITLPEGYKIESLPQSLSLTLKDNIGSFKYNITATGSQIQLSAILDVNRAIIMPEYYQELKDFFRKMIEKQNEKVVLIKI